MNILVTGGLGYIGSHIVVELLNNNFYPIIIDNLSNSYVEVISNIEKITNKKIIFFQGDILNENILKNIFQTYNIKAVIHLAGVKSVSESNQNPMKYYTINVNGTITLFKIMKEYNCNNIIFSSSATVYGNINKPPYTENDSIGTGITNTYGKTKYISEIILSDLKINSIRLRYFNPIGAHNSGLIGENPKNTISSNIMPNIINVLIDRKEYLEIYGNDYETLDGTPIRDYIHIMDLASGHLYALNYLLQKERNNEIVNDVFNLGTGKGTSVFELITQMEKISNSKIKYKIEARRDGDLSEIYANCDKANEILNWKIKYNIQDMCRDTFNYILKNRK